MMWTPDPAIDAAARHPAWRHFHRECGKVKLYFDRIERDGKRGPYKTVAFTIHPSRAGGYSSEALAEGRGKTVFDSLSDAYAKAGRRAVAAEPYLAQMGAPPAPTLEDMFG